MTSARRVVGVALGAALVALGVGCGDDDTGSVTVGSSVSTPERGSGTPTSAADGSITTEPTVTDPAATSTTEPAETTAPTTSEPAAATTAPRADEPLGPAGSCLPDEQCVTLALAEDGTLVSYDRSTGIVSFARGTPAPVALVPSAAEGILFLVAVGPDDVVYFAAQQPETEDPVGYVKAVSTHPDNAGQTVAASSDIDLSGDSDLFGTPAGLVSVGCCGGERRPALDAALVMSWVDHSGATVTSDRPNIWIDYGSDGTATFNIGDDSGSVSWSAPNAFTRSMPVIAALDDGGLIVDLTDSFAPELPSRVIRFSLDSPPREIAVAPAAVLLIEPTGALIAVRDGEYVRLSPWG